MASEPLQMFVTGSHTLEITAYRLVKDLGKGKCIQSEPFAVGGYDWMIQYYPRGIHEQQVACAPTDKYKQRYQPPQVNDEYLSVYVKLLSTKREVQAMYSFSIFEWHTGNWSTTNTTVSDPDLSLFKPSSEYSSYGERNFMNKQLLENRPQIYLKNNALKIMCTLYVLLPQPAPVPAPFGCGFHTDSYAPPNLPRQQTVRIYCNSAKHLSLTARNGVVVLAPADSRDRYQHWIKDMSHGDSLTDGCPAFALVNSVTGEALKTPPGENQEVSLVAYKPNNLEDFRAQPVEWYTDFKAIRIKDMEWFNMTALPSPKCANNFDGAKIVIKHWSDTTVQHWNIVPYNSNVPYNVICNH